MAWSYRVDRSDEIYTAKGPVVVQGSQRKEAPATGAAPVASDIENSQIANNPVTVYTADGALAVTAGTDVISKAGSAAAMTLAAPTAAQNGMRKVIVAGTAFAHVITATGLIDDGVTGGAKNSITLGAFVGASATVMAYNLHWVLVAKTVATVA